MVCLFCLLFIVCLQSIDVLPLLHTGIKANKFKFGQNKSKVRTFYLTKDNQWFCWEPVGGPLQAKPNRKKIDPTRSSLVLRLID